LGKSFGGEAKSGKIIVGDEELWMAMFTALFFFLSSLESLSSFDSHSSPIRASPILFYFIFLLVIILVVHILLLLFRTIGNEVTNFTTPIAKPLHEPLFSITICLTVALLLHESSQVSNDKCNLFIGLFFFA
jgi:hypothetical protein